MTLALAYSPEREQLAAPREVRAEPPLSLVMLPPSIGEVTPDAAVVSPSVLDQARELADRHPTSPTALSRLAQCELNFSNRDEAVAASERSLRLAQERPDPCAAVAAVKVLAACGESGVAHDLVTEIGSSVLPPFTQAEVAVWQRQLREALVELDGVDQPAAQALRGWIFLELGEYGPAIHELRSAVREGPQRTDVLSNLGYAFAAIGARSKAISVTRQALHIAPYNRAVAFNLAGFHALGGDYRRALEQLRDLSRKYPADLKIVAALAELRLRLADHVGALKELKAARGRAAFTNASTEERSELAANIAFMELRLGKRTRGSAVDALLRELTRCDYSSIGIGHLLLQLWQRTSDRNSLRGVYEGFARVHSSDELLAIATQLAFLETSFAHALELTSRWVALEPFSSEAATMHTFLLGDIADDYEGGAQFGEQALLRTPGNEMLQNNVAFAWALARRPDRARARLPRTESSPQFAATQALIQLAEGDVRGGIEGYERAARLAEEAGDTGLGQLVRSRLNISLVQLDLMTPVKLEAGPLPRGDPRAAVLQLLIERLSHPRRKGPER